MDVQKNTTMFIYEILMGLIIILCPFISSVQKMNSFGGLGTEGNFIPAVIAVILWLFCCLFLHEKILLPQAKSFWLLCAFMSYLLISGVLHIEDLLFMQYQGVHAYSRYFVQLGSMIFYFLLALFAYNFFYKYQNKYVEIIQTCIYLSFTLAGGYSLIEILSLIGHSDARDLLIVIDSLFRGNELNFYYRLRSLTAEASYLGMYIGFVLPWILSGFFQYNTKRRYLFLILFVYISLMCIMTMSRTGYVAYIIEILVWGYLFAEDLVKEKFAIAVSVILFFVVIVGSSEFFEQWEEYASLDMLEILTSLLQWEGAHNVSNISRYGSQIAALSMFCDFPFCGVGFGMFGFHAVDYYPAWAWESYEIARWWGVNSVVDPAWPPSHGLYARILGETGICGFILWGVMLLHLWKEATTSVRACVDRREKIFCRNCLLSFLAVIMSGFNVDAFRILFMWIVYAMIWMNFSRTKKRLPVSVR